MAGAVERWINEVWYGKWIVVALLLTPLSWVYGAIVSIRRALYQAGLLRSTELVTPVIVVGNLTVGGTGKTPVTIWLVNQLKARGFKVGVVSRGYGGEPGDAPLAVTSDSDPAIAGDEPVLIARQCSCPVVVNANRVAAAQALEQQGVDVIVADDGLQHYALARRFEIAVVDGSRGFGNRLLLPAGPLREPQARLQEVNCILLNVSDDSGIQLAVPLSTPVHRFRLSAHGARQLAGEEVRELASFAGQRVHAVAAIGNPRRFFSLLEQFGVDVIRHPLPDHAPIYAQDLKFDDALPILITEKDAVKCRDRDLDNVWYVPVSAEIDNADWLDDLETLLRDSACVLTFPS